MTNEIVEDAAGYTVAAADIYAAFRAMPASTSVADDWNAMAAVEQAVSGRSGLRIVDLGCGPGTRTRQIASMPEAAITVGVDRSRDQLALARAAAGSEDCRFYFGDLVALGAGDGGWAAGEDAVADLLGSFDVAVMGFVTSHAATQDELDAMLRAAAAFLNPGGRLIVIDAHPALDLAPFPRCDQYGVIKRFVLPDGHTGVVPAFTKIRTTFVTPGGELTVEDYFHDVHSWSAAVEAAGLTGLTIENLSAPPGPDPGFWDPYIISGHPAGCSHAAVIRACKPEQ